MLNAFVFDVASKEKYAISKSEFIWFNLFILQTRENNKMDELLERIHQLENNEAVILKESHELKEQNELLEFRIIELEEATTEKVNLFLISYCYRAIEVIFDVLVAWNWSSIRRKVFQPHQAINKFSHTLIKHRRAFKQDLLELKICRPKVAARLTGPPFFFFITQIPWNIEHLLGWCKPFS